MKNAIIIMLIRTSELLGKVYSLHDGKPVFHT